MDLAFESGCVLLLLVIMLVSILVLMDLAFESLFADFESDDFMRFQSLF